MDGSDRFFFYQPKNILVLGKFPLQNGIRFPKEFGDR